jgi:uncharacterized protein YgiM (DUF1202 family)
MTLATAALLTLPPANLAYAQDTASPGSAAAPVAGPYIAVVTGNSVNVRSGPSAQSAYVFGKLRQGDTVQVLAEEFGWAKVRTSGPAFASLFAYVPADRRVTLGQDGTASVNARTDLRAPNVDAGGSPDKSWKQIGQVDAGATLTVLGTVNGEKESVYKVAMPASGEGWVNMQFIRRANGQEAAAFSAGAAPTAPAVGTLASTEQTAPAPGVGAPAPTEAAPAVPQLSAQTSGSPAIPPLLGTEPTRAVPAGTKTDSHGEGSIEAAPKATVTRTVTRRATWTDLESQWEAVRAQPQATAELDALRARYNELAASAPAKSSLAHMARTRAEQLGLLQEAQRQTQELAALRGKSSERTRAMYQLVLDIQKRSDYVAVGILNASVVYDGKSLPQLYRITDPQTSQTIAYVLPNESLPMGTMLGTLVGVKGGREFDSALNMNVISPQVVELLTVRDTPQVTKVEVKTEQTQPASALAEKAPAPVTKPEGAAPAAAPGAAPEASPAPGSGGPASQPQDCPEEVPPGFAPDTPPTTTP